MFIYYLCIITICSVLTSSAEPYPQNVGVNIPGLYLMDLFTGKEGTNLGINVLNGLVRVGVGRRKAYQQQFDSYGQYNSPRSRTGIHVEAFNIPIYQGVH